MDKANKEALKIWTENGIKEHIKYMFKDNKTGRQLS
jgi:hypothetical protein